MEKLNTEEKKTLGYLESLKGAIQDGDRSLMKELNDARLNINWKSVRSSILEEVRELSEIETYLSKGMMKRTSKLKL